MSIKEIKEKIKSVSELYIQPTQNIEKYRNLWLSLAVILVGVAGFGLGRISIKENTESLLKIYDEPVSVPFLKDNTVVASKNGTKYHFLWCSGAKSISEVNKITFKNKDEAEKAGYTLAGNCKEL